MKPSALFLLGSFALLISWSAASQSSNAGLGFGYERIKSRKAVQFDPKQAYLLVETNLVANIEFVKAATADESERWQALRLEAVAQATAEGVQAEQVAWPAVESQLRVRMDVLGHFRRNRDAVLYLYEVPPGTYTFYAHNSYKTQDCACMGSVSFPADAGVITALRIQRRYLDTDGKPQVERPKGVSELEGLMRSALEISPPTDQAYDDRLANSEIVAAVFTPVPAVPNWGHYIVNRVLPMDGLFRYERDQLVRE